MARNSYNFSYEILLAGNIYRFYEKFFPYEIYINFLIKIIRKKDIIIIYQFNIWVVYFFSYESSNIIKSLELLIQNFLINIILQIITF